MRLRATRSTASVRPRYLAIHQCVQAKASVSMISRSARPHSTLPSAALASIGHNVTRDSHCPDGPRRPESLRRQPRRMCGHRAEATRRQQLVCIWAEKIIVSTSVASPQNGCHGHGPVLRPAGTSHRQARSRGLFNTRAYMRRFVLLPGTVLCSRRSKGVAARWSRQSPCRASNFLFAGLRSCSLARIMSVTGVALRGPKTRPQSLKNELPPPDNAPQTDIRDASQPTLNIVGGDRLRLCYAFTASYMLQIHRSHERCLPTRLVSIFGIVLQAPGGPLCSLFSPSLVKQPWLVLSCMFQRGLHPRLPPSQRTSNNFTDCQWSRKGIWYGPRSRRRPCSYRYPHLG